VRGLTALSLTLSESSSRPALRRFSLLLLRENLRHHTPLDFNDGLERYLRLISPGEVTLDSS
jgi:hypothetical protein